MLHHFENLTEKYLLKNYTMRFMTNKIAWECRSHLFVTLYIIYFVWFVFAFSRALTPPTPFSASASASASVSATASASASPLWHLHICIYRFITLYSIPKSMYLALFRIQLGMSLCTYVPSFLWLPLEYPCSWMLYLLLRIGIVVAHLVSLLQIVRILGILRVWNIECSFTIS